MDPIPNSHVVPTLDHVIGQSRAVAILRTAIASYFYERTKVKEELAFPHLLISGPAGVGKTLLSETVARECCCTITTDLAQSIRTPEQVHGALMCQQRSDNGPKTRVGPGRCASGGPRDSAHLVK
jgi:Holliday junction DNA helicase RuvB